MRRKNKLIKNENAKATDDESRKERILDAALELFATQGYGSTRVETIAKKAKLSYGLTYYHFSSKDIQFHMVLQRSLDRSTTIYPSAMGREDSAYEKLRYFAETFLAYAKTKEGASGLLIMSHALTSDGIPQLTRIMVRDRMQQLGGILEGMIKEAQADGHAADKSSAALASMFLALIIGSAFLRIANAKSDFPDTDTFLCFLS